MAHFPLVTSIVGILWAIFLVYWLVSATKAKRTVHKGPAWGWGILVRIGLFVIFIFAAQFPSLTSGRFSTAVGVVGVIFCATGIAFAIWARMHIGRNWGMPMSVRENPELVTSGPYRFVRHPIYTGTFFAMLGSALAAGTFWFFVFIWFAVYFIWSATREEKLMAAQFPAEYPEYKKRTKMLIPFLF